ncbi:MAG: serine/threonine protein kinase [Deltaproteobacteria bacterium]|nr:serine/threonine protein kinase [Deltaproteobacteria bacterium]
MPNIPPNIGKYRIEKVLGHGAMGVVYLGFDCTLERKVAIKTIKSEYLACSSDNKDYLIRLKREAQAAGRLHHPNIAVIHDFGIDDDKRPFIVMEYIAGRELKEILEQGPGKSDLSFTCEIVTQVLDALNYAHRRGVVHRDIKPSNLLIKADNSVAITDFGIAHIDTSELTLDGSIMGTPNYMAPEQLLGQQIDQRADLFSVGVLLYEMVTGEKPYPGKGAAGKITSMLKEPLIEAGTLNLRLLPELNRIINKALAIDKEERYQSASEFLLDLTKLNPSTTKAAAADNNLENLTIITSGASPKTEKKEVSYDLNETIFTTTCEETIFAETPKKTPAPAGPTEPTPPPGLPPYRSLKTGIALFAVLVLVAAALGGRHFFLPSTKDTPLQKAEVNLQNTKEVQLQVNSASRGKLPGRVRIDSAPPGSEVLLAGEIKGKTPCLITLPQGDYDLVLQQTGYEELAVMVSVLTDREIDFTVNLKAR